MAYALASYEGSIESWGSSNFYSDLLAAVRVHSATLTISNPATDTTGDGHSSMRHIAGLGEWSADVSAMAFASPRLGNQLLVSGSGLYSTHVQSWSLTMATNPLPNTDAAVTPPTWRSTRPGLLRLSGSWTAHITSGAALPLPSQPGSSPVTLTLRYGDSTVDETLSLPVIITRARPQRPRGQIQVVEYAFEGSGDLTPAGTNSVFGTTALSAMPWSAGGTTAGALVFATMDGTRFFTGDDSFLRTATISANVGANEPVNVSLGIQGIGAITST